MRLARTSLLARLTAPDLAPVVLLEAPPGYGKSWLARRAAGADVLRLKGALGPLGTPTASIGTVLVDDAHLLSPDDIERLVECIERAEGDDRLIIAARLFDDAVHEVAELVDALILDTAALAVSVAEIDEATAGRPPVAAARLVEAADGNIRTIATALDQSLRDPSADPVAIAAHMTRIAGESALHQLDGTERSVVALLARAPGIDRLLLDRLGGAGFVGRAVAAGVPIRRQITGSLDLAASTALRGAPIDPVVAGRFGDDLLARGRVLEAVGLVLDAGDHERATAMMKNLSESVAETVEPRPILGVLARLGSRVDREPELLLLRAGASRVLGRVDEATADIDRAVACGSNASPAVRRRLAIESARARMTEGDNEAAVRIGEETLAELGEGEGRTFARAHQVLAECAATSDALEDLQRAAESYRVAANAWEACSEFARARACRSALALAVLCPLGRFDEALAQTGQLLGAPDLSDAERSSTLYTEAFVLLNANRLDAAGIQFERVADLGYVHDNPRLIALAAWGLALVAARRSDLHATLRWIATVENTAFGKADDLLGIPFLCDVAEMLGALGDLDAAAASLERITERGAVYPGQVLSARFILAARRGELGDLAEALANTLPLAWWRVKLTASHALAVNGRYDDAQRMLDDALRELVSLGFGDFESLGEGRIHAAVLAALDGRNLAEPVLQAPAERGPTPASSHGNQRLAVMHGPMELTDDAGPLAIPPGNPQRLVGVIVANGGSVTIDQASEALWGNDDAERSRTRLRNVLLRLRRAVGDLVVRTGNGLRLAPRVSCDLYDFRRRADDALATARADPDLAGELAALAVTGGDTPLFADFEYEEWAVTARREVDQRRIDLLDLLSVQAEDAGDLQAAQALAERALRLDRYTDSRYVRLAELLTMQDRVAAAIAVLDDAAAVAKELGDSSPGAVKHRRDELLRRAVSGV